MDSIGANGFMQICLVVRDADRTMKHFKDLLHVEDEKLKTIPSPATAPTFYRGKQIDTKTKYYVFQYGGLTIEITEPDEESSVWKEVLDTRGEGLCYLGVKVDDSEQVVDFLERQGFPRVHYGGTPDSNYNIVDTSEALGFMLNVKTIK